jgi:hypothetical protein
LPLARELHGAYPDEPLVCYWLATINHRLADGLMKPTRG